MNLKDRVRNQLDEILEEEFFVVEISFLNKKPKSKLLVLVDGDQGISIDKCAEISRSLANYLEEANLIEQAFVLEVSSPGLDKPLKMQRQYHKNIGRLLKLVLKDGSTETGTLKEVADNQIVIERDNNKKKNKKQMETEQTLSLVLDEIARAEVLVSFK